MLIMRSILALDKKTISIQQSSNNLNEVPGWLAGSSLVLSQWNIDLVTPTGTTSLTELEYPLVVHHTFAEETTITEVKLFRLVGTEELFFSLTPDTISGTVLDLRIEFKEQTNI